VITKRVDEFRRYDALATKQFIPKMNAEQEEKHFPAERRHPTVYERLDSEIEMHARHASLRRV